MRAQELAPTHTESYAPAPARGLGASAVLAGLMLTAAPQAQARVVSMPEMRRAVYTGTWMLEPQEKSKARASNVSIDQDDPESGRVPYASPTYLVGAHYTDALKFVSMLPDRIAAPKTTFSDEDAYCEWSSDGHSVLVSFEGNDSFGYALLKDGMYVPGDIEVDSVLDQPTDLYEYLAAHFAL